MKYEVSFDITVPKDIKKEKIEEWIGFEIQMQGSMKLTKETKHLDWHDLKPRCLVLSARGG